MNDQNNDQQEEQENWNAFQATQQEKKDASIEAEYDAFMDAINNGDTEALAVIADNAWEYTPPTLEDEETEAEEQEIEAEYFVSYVTIPESKVKANISTSNHVDGKYFVCLEGGADGYQGYADTLADAEELGKALIEEYENFETDLE